MKRTTTILLTLLMAASALAQMGVSRGHDLDALWARAQADYDLTTLDALLLLESRHVEITAHGDLATTVHRVVWIGTHAGLRAHADLRIPWDSDTSTFEVHALRTWRDGRWWLDAVEISPTAVVETLPHALDRCPDYAGMRETMLLHDGVELPCLLETAYTITERGGAARGADDVFVMTRREPALRVEYRLTAPKIPIETASLNGAPEPVIDGNSRVWTLVDTPRLRLPTTDRAELYEPTLAWSTWPDRETLLSAMTDPVLAAAAIPDALADTLAARLETVHSDLARARAVVALLDEDVRAVHLADAFRLCAPRTGVRTWETAYGHDLDRTVLALAMFRAAELPAGLVPWSTYGPTAPDVACAADYERLVIGITGPNGVPVTVYDAARGGLRPGAEYRRPTLDPDRRQSRIALDLDLARGDDDAWTGRGYLAADGALSPYGLMAGIDGEAADHLGHVLDTALPGATLDAFTPVFFTPERVEVGFTFSFDPGEPDADGRLRIELGDLPGGALDMLPADVHPEDPARESPVHLRAGASQALSLRIDTGGLDVVGSPAPDEGGEPNPAGRFQLKVARDGSILTIARSLRLNDVKPVTRWLELRELLLAETDPAHRIVLLDAD